LGGFAGIKGYISPYPCIRQCIAKKIDNGGLGNEYRRQLGTDLLSDQVKSILYDAEDDKIGRIRDVYHEEIKRVALWVEKNYDSDRHAKWMYDEATEYL
jgi:hypothetical protein